MFSALASNGWGVVHLIHCDVAGRAQHFLAGYYDLRGYGRIDLADELAQLRLGGFDCQAKPDALVGFEMIAQQHLAGFDQPNQRPAADDQRHLLSFRQWSAHGQWTLIGRCGFVLVAPKANAVENPRPCSSFSDATDLRW